MRDASFDPQPINRLWLRIAAGLIVLSWLGALQVLWRCYVIGGHKWLQGDWLINLGAGPVRRGPLGQAVLQLSDASGVPPLTLVIIAQAALATMLFLGLAVLVLRQTQPALAMLVFSAALFPTLWTADALSGFRKELLPLVALVLLALPGGGIGRLILSAAAMVAAAWGHEIGVLLLPAWLVTLYLLRPGGSAWVLRLMAGMTCALVILAGVYAVRFPDLVVSDAVCAALTQRQSLHRDFCNGSIAWLSIKGNGLEAVRYGLSMGQNSALLPFAMILSVGPLAYLWWSGRFGRRLLWLALLAIAPVCLLYPLALDWGRWLSIQVTTVSLLVLGLGARNRLPPLEAPSHMAMVIWLALACFTGVQTMTEVKPPALLNRLVQGFRI